MRIAPAVVALGMVSSVLPRAAADQAAHEASGVGAGVRGPNGKVHPVVEDAGTQRPGLALEAQDQHRSQLLQREVDGALRFAVTDLVPARPQQVCGAPAQLVLASGVAQALMLPFLALAALYLRYRLTGAMATGELHIFAAKAVLFATGGFGRIFKITSNAHANTGDGPAICARSGIPLEDMEFFQFHPTGIKGLGILISEAVLLR